MTRHYKKQVVIVTGMSGAGKTSVMRALEDFGFYCVDNLPVPLFSDFLGFIFKSPTPIIKVAIGIDARTQTFLKGALREVQKLRSNVYKYRYFTCKIIFLNSSDDVLIKRFEETRRKHPLSKGVDITTAIKREKALLKPLQSKADIVLDTNTFNIHELRRWVQSAFVAEKLTMNVHLISFGFKYGIPTESNLMYDIRFLPNPYFIPTLREYDGREESVQKFIFEQPQVHDYWEKFSSFLQFSLRKSYEEGRFFTSVGIGCTGGRHRSVAFVERLAKESWENITFTVFHRDIEKRS